MHRKLGSFLEVTRTNLFESAKFGDELRPTKNEFTGVDTKFRTATQNVAQMGREMKGMEKTLKATKGHGDNAASRISELERELSLRTDEFKAV